MPNPYDDLITAPGQVAAGGPPKNPYDDVIVDEQARLQTQLRASVGLAAESNPQAVAAQRQLAKYAGFAPAVGEALPNEVKQMATVKRVATDTAGQPVLQKAYSNEEFARIGHDDSGPLKAVGDAIGKTAAYVVGATPDGGLPQRAYTGLVLNGEIGAAGFFRHVSEWVAAPFNLAGLDKVTSIGGNPLQRLADGFGMLGQSAQAEKDRLVKADNSILGGGVDSGIESAFQNAKYMPLALLGPPGIAAALAGMVAETGGTTYQADREKGVLPGRAGVHAATDMVAEYVGERYFGAAGFLKKLAAGSSAGKLAVYELTRELPGEVGTTLWQNFNEWTLTNQTKPVAQFLEEQPAAIAQTIVATLVGGGGQIAIGKSITKVAENVFGRQAQIEEAQGHVERLQDLFKRATETKTWERDPETFGNLVQQMAEGTPNAPTSVFVDARTLVDTLQANPEAEGVFNQMPQEVKDQVQEALAVNGTVEIPLGELVAKGAGTALESALLPHVRRTENSLSATEAKAASAQSAVYLQQEADRVIAESEQGEAIRTSSEAVGQKVLEQLNAIGRNTADVNQSYATLIKAFYTATSARIGMTPEQMLAKYPLQINGQTVGEGYNAGKLGEITVEGYHYSKADRSVISTSMYGTGLQGSNREAFQNAKDQRLSKRAYFYADTGTGVNPEAGVGGRGHKATLTNIYDSNSDPLRLKGGSQQDFESKVLDAGFSGYLDRMSGTQSGQVILLGDQNVPVQSLGALAKTQGQVVPAPAARESKGRDVVVDALNADKALPSGSPTIARWQELLANNPEVLQALTDAGVFAGDQTRTAYKSELISAYQAATPAESYAQSLTTMVPSTKGAAVDPTDVKVPGLDAADQPDEKSQKALEANVSTFDKKEQVIADKPKRGYDSIKVEGNTLREKAESIITQMVRNLRTIFAAIPESVRQRSKLWYDGANRISLAFADRYNLTPMQTAGQLAVTSPQADWYMNVSYVERINDILAYRQDHAWDSEMETWAEDWISSDTQVEGRAKEAARRQQAIRDAVREERAAQKAVDKARSDLEKNTPKLEAKIAETEATLAESEAALKAAKKAKDDKATAKAQKLRDKHNEEAKAARVKLREAKSAVSKAETVLRKAGETIQEKRDYAAVPDANLEVQALIRGKKLSELTTDFERAWWVRAYDEAHNPRNYRVVSPEGGFLDFAKLEDGTTNDSIGWKSFNAIAKAISIHRDGSVANISAQLGGEHKVRNFYNNIFDPNSATPFVTSDTHQVAANLFLPLGADALEVGQNFGGTGSKSVGATGLNGTYWLFHEAVVRAAKAEGVKPREMQSISWEAIRNLFSPSFKANADSVTAVRDLWVKYHDGNASYEDTIRDIVDLAGGKFRDPAWVGVRPDSTAAPEDGATSYESGLAHARSGDQRREQPGLGDAGDAGQNVPAAGDLNGRLEQAGDRGGRNTGGGYTPLAGAPSHAGATGPIPGLVAVAEQYARDNGIDLKRQAEYVQVDPALGRRIAEAYAAMEHAPNDPRVKATYDALIKETRAQYDALVAAGYTFTFFDSANDPYKGNPWAAMRDIRDNKTMAVYGTYDGYGNDVTGFETDKNLLVVPTGLQWPDQAGVMRDVTANDLFRAVHDAFGHGLEGAGFRGTGEANAFEAHARLFSPAAMMALTNETRAQNSWLNLNPDLLLGVVGYAKAVELHPDNWQAISVGEHNQNAKVEDTIFADQKNGVLPEWTWTEGRAGDTAAETLQQGPRGTFNPKTLTISLRQDANLSTFLHESGHFFLEVMADLASQPDAPEQIKSDFAKTLKWFGIKDAEDGTKALDVWHAMSLDEKRPYHERWAESFEQYLIEGKAPSLELRGAFQRFRGWLITVYKSLKDFAAGRELQISGEIRQVMDRLVATEEQIAEAEQQAKYEAIYKSAEEAGMDEHEWAVYQEMHKEGTDTAIDEMQKRSMADMRWAAEARSKALRKAQRAVEELRKAMHAQVTEEVMATPLELARAYIKELRQSTPEQKAALKAWTEQRTAALAAALDGEKAALIAANPEAKGLQKGQLLAKNKKAMENAAEAKAIAWEQQNPRPTPVLPAVEMDSIAERFGFTSGDELAKAMKEQPSAKDTIEGITEQRLLEEHGELVTQKGIQQAANEAVHNEARARFVATELATLQHAMNQKAKAPGARVSTNVLVKAAKEFAQAIVARRKIMDLRPGRYTAAETRAAAAVQQAMAAGDQQAAVSAQRDRLLNLYAAKETVAAREEIKRAVEYLRKFEKDAVRTKLPPEYLDQIDALLEKFDLKQATTQKEIARRKSLAAWITSQQDLGIEPNIPQELIDKAGLTSYKDMTVEEFRGLTDTIKQIEHLGRLKSKLLTAKDQREYAAIRDAIAQSINDNAGNRKADTRTPTTNLGRWLQAVKNFGAAHIKAATWARVMDGGKDGGPVWEYFIRPANERGDMETTMRAEAAKKLHEIIDPWLQGKPAGGKGVYFDSIKRSLNRESILAIALNTGNESNLQRLLGGEGWTLAQLKPVLDTLTPADWQVVQNIWDHFESYRPLIGAKEMRVFGKEPEWIAHGSPVTGAYGVAGGYYPIKYDPAASVRAEEHADAEGAKRLLKGAYGAATTQRSFTKGRVEEVNGRPLLYTLSGLYAGVNDVIHDLAWHEWLIDVNRLLKSQTIDTAIREHYGPEAVRQLKSWRDAVAEGDSASQEAIDSALSRLRQGVSVAGLGFNVMSALMQPLGMTQSIARVGAKWIGKGVMQYIGNPVATTKDVQERSEFMASRARTRFRELNEIRNTVQGQTKAKTAMTQTAYFLMMQCQQMVDVPTWLGAYEKAVSEGNDEERSTALADQAVIDAQGGGQTKDLSAIERGGPAQKLFTVFYSFMNTALNLGVQKGMTSEPTAAGRAKLAADMLLLYTVPAVLGALLKDALTPGDSGDGDDWRKLLKKLLGEQLTFLLGLMVVAREFGEAGKGLLGLSDHPRDYAGPAGVRVISDAGTAAKQVQQGEFDDQLRKSVINLAGSLMGLPAAQMNRTITGAMALKEGKTQNPAALALGYQEPR